MAKELKCKEKNDEELLKEIVDKWTKAIKGIKDTEDEQRSDLYGSEANNL